MRVAGVARGHQILRRVVCLVAVKVIGNKGAGPRSAALNPLHDLAAPVAGMLAGANLLEEHTPVLHDLPAAHRQGMIRRPHHAIDAHAIFGPLRHLGPVALSALRSLSALLAAAFRTGIRVPSAVALRGMRIGVSCVRNPRLAAMTPRLLNAFRRSAVRASVLRMFAASRADLDRKRAARPAALHAYSQLHVASIALL